jgi:hypothetical protein
VPSISTSTLPDGEVGASYNPPALVATGGTTNYSWAISSGLPPGLSINSGTGKLSGVPTSSGSFPMTIVVTDAAGATNSVTITIIINVGAANGLSLSNQTGGGSALVGTRLYYRGASAGSFTLTNTIATAGTATSSNFAALAGTTTGFSFAAGTVSTPAGGPFVSAPFSWGNGTASGPTETVTGTDSFGGNASTTLTFVNDSTAPAPTIGAAPPAYTNSTTPTISGTAGTQAPDATHSADSGSVTVKIYAGPTPTGSPLQTLTSLVTAGAWSVTPVGLPANAQYTAQVTQTDAVGNSGTASKTFVIDTVAPAVTAAMSNGGGGSKITVAGTAGTQTADASHSADATTVSVAICTAANYTSHGNTCSSAWAAFNTAAVAIAAGAYTVTTGNIGTGTYYATVTQSDGAGNLGSTTTGPFVR